MHWNAGDANRGENWDPFGFVKKGVNWVEDHLGVGGGSSGPPMPGAVRPPINTGPQTLPIGTGGAGATPFSSAQQQQLQSAFSAAGIWDTIQGLGGDVWGVITKILPKDANGNIDWGGALKDVGSWVSSHKADILDGLNVYNQYERSQKSDQYAKQALDLANQRYADQAPLRTAGLAGMQNPGSIGANTAAITKQGQNGLQLAAPAPVRAPTLNLANAQTLATSGGANPFTKNLPPAPTQPQGLPLAAPATPTAPAMPIAPQIPGTQIPGMRKILPLGQATY